MALIKCKECGKDISDSSTECIHCGAPISFTLKDNEATTKSKRRNNRKRTIHIVFISLAFAFVIVAIYIILLLNLK